MTEESERENPADNYTEPTLQQRLVEFVHTLRSEGVEVPNDGSIVAAEVLNEVGIRDRERTKAALQAALVSNSCDLSTFERLFPLFWEQIQTEIIDGKDTEQNQKQKQEREEKSLAVLTDRNSSPKQARPTDPGSTVTASKQAQGAEESTADSKTVSEYSRFGHPSEIQKPVATTEAATLKRAVRQLVEAIANLQGRRTEHASRGEFFDVRRALRESFQTGGIIASKPMRTWKRTEIRCVVLVDVSQSVLDVIDRSFLLRWLCLLDSECRNMRTFFFDTDIREVTDEIGKETTDAAVRALRAAEVEWGGGTRIGEALLELRDSHPGAVDRRTTVFVVSDGLETGEIEAVEEGMSWLSRRANLVLWCNPLAADESYEPKSRGMAASVPFIDCLIEFTSVESVQELTYQLTQFDEGNLPGYTRR